MNKRLIIVPIMFASLGLVACGGSTSASEQATSTTAAATISKTEASTNSASTNSIFSSNYILASNWVETSFGKNAIYCELGKIKDKSGDFFQVVIPSDYTSSDSKKAFDQVSSSMASLVISGVKYKEISVKYVDKDYKEIVEFSLSLGSSGKYGLDVVSGDLTNSDAISSSLK